MSDSGSSDAGRFLGVDALGASPSDCSVEVKPDTTLPRSVATKTRGGVCPAVAGAIGAGLWTPATGGPCRIGVGPLFPAWEGGGGAAAAAVGGVGSAMVRGFN